MPGLLPIHIISAALALVAGAVALTVAKGGSIHRQSGLVFSYTMFAMCGSAVVAAAFKGQWMNLVAGVMTGYLVITGLFAVRPSSPSARPREMALAILALTLGSALMAVGVMAIFSRSGQAFGNPALPSLLFGTLGLVGGVGDWRVLRQGPLRGGRRLARHLWRMCMALFIAVVSFVSIRQRVASLLPEPFASPVARALPVGLVLGAMGYWLWRVRSREGVSAPRAVTAQSISLR